MANGSSSPGRISGQRVIGPPEPARRDSYGSGTKQSDSLVTQGVRGSGSARAGFTKQCNSSAPLNEPTIALPQPCCRDAGTTLGSSKSAWGKE